MSDYTDGDRFKLLEIAALTATTLTGDKRNIVQVRRAILDAQHGARSANLEPSRGDRYETIVTADGPMLVRVPANDPTGEAAIGPDDAGAALRELDRLIGRIDDAFRDLLAIRDEWLPKRGLVKVDDGPGDDWCRSCWRDHRYCEPVSDRYAGLCRWCGDWRAANRQDPPVPILRARHAGERITRQMVERYTRRAS